MAPQSTCSNGIYADYEKMAAEGASHRCVQLTNRRMDKASHRDARTHLKKETKARGELNGQIEGGN